MKHAIAIGAGALAAVVLAGCGGGSGPGASGTPSASSTSSTSVSPTSVTPDQPTEWMLDATVRWTNRAGSSFGAFKSVRQDGKLWDGDPRRYEKACGATFLVNGDTPDLEKPIPGRGESSPTYYQWLQSDPARWSAFNAWLSDPAVVHSLSDGLTGPLKDYVGTTEDCQDPSAAAAS